MRTHICVTFLKFIFRPHTQPYALYHSSFSLLKISQLHHRSQTPSSHTSTTKEPLLHNNIPAVATGYNLERTHGHNSGPLWHPATRPNNAGTTSPPRTTTGLQIMDKYFTTENVNKAYFNITCLCTRPNFVNEISSPLDLQWLYCTIVHFLWLRYPTWRWSK